MQKFFAIFYLGQKNFFPRVLTNLSSLAIMIIVRKKQRRAKLKSNDLRKENVKMKKILILCLAIAAIFLGGCENGLENPHDTPQQSYIGAVPIADTEFEQFPQATPQIEHTEEHENAAVTMFIQDISPSGLSFFFANNSDREFIYFPRYALYIRQNNAWQPVEPIVDWALFPDIVFGILPHSTTEMRTIDWQWRLGELSDGEYKFQKEIIFSHSRAILTFTLWSGVFRCLTMWQLCLRTCLTKQYRGVFQYQYR